MKSYKVLNVNNICFFFARNEKISVAEPVGFVRPIPQSPRPIALNSERRR